jgi:hypothetical protein
LVWFWFLAKSEILEHRGWISFLNLLYLSQPSIQCVIWNYFTVFTPTSFELYGTIEKMKLYYVLPTPLSRN